MAPERCRRLEKEPEEEEGPRKQVTRIRLQAGREIQLYRPPKAG